MFTLLLIALLVGIIAYQQGVINSNASAHATEIVDTQNTVWNEAVVSTIEDCGRIYRSLNGITGVDNYLRTLHDEHKRFAVVEPAVIEAHIEDAYIEPYIEDAPIVEYESYDVDNSQLDTDWMAESNPFYDPQVAYRSGTGS